MVKILRIARLYAKRLGASLYLALLCSPPLQAEVSGFQDRYFADVDGNTWVLQLEANKTFQSMVTAKLQMGDTRNRYLLMGGVNKMQITGSYKPLFGSSDNVGGERSFEIQRIDDSRLRLTLNDDNGKTKERLIFTANTQQAPIDTAILGTWFTIAEPDGKLDQPYLGEQWAISFKDDGTLCEASYGVDTRKAQTPKDPCGGGIERRWKAVDGKVYTIDKNEEWAMQFNYRLMGGRMVVSYPGGKRRVANMAQNLKLSADNR
ncbi:hypothetical protein [Zhongshania aliphaticivorans]|uniref:hypothetical protein n=1 Tax=Zhongshania aliphaticivorans TaxID=1470434 RepID=UPI0012E6C8AC|nr:hypothetical protein [Zhongshania aliphaticivorans]CAA0097442.1 Uncharacterised protein [Zhongshania aliphaticivorans]